MELHEWRLKDKRGQRKRTAPRQPNDNESCELIENDLKVLQFIHQNGGMQSTQSIAEWGLRTGIFGFSRESKDPYKYVRHRLKVLYHNLGVLERYEEQTTFEFMKRYYVDQKISHKGIELLKEYSLHEPNAFKASGSYLHQRMAASLYSSYLINCLDHNIPFTHQHEITDNIAIETDVGILIPDAVFKITIGGKDILIFLEADRSTEPGYSKDNKRKSWGKTVAQYQQVIGHGLYKKAYNLPPNCGAQVHVVTNKPSMHNKILENVAHHFPQGCTYILVHTTQGFGKLFFPQTVLDMLSVPWERYKHSAWRYI